MCIMVEVIPFFIIIYVFYIMLHFLSHPFIFSTHPVKISISEQAFSNIILMYVIYLGFLH